MTFQCKCIPARQFKCQNYSYCRKNGLNAQEGTSEPLEQESVWETTLRTHSMQSFNSEASSPSPEPSNCYDSGSYSSTDGDSYSCTDSSTSDSSYSSYSE